MHCLGLIELLFIISLNVHSVELPSQKIDSNIEHHLEKVFKTTGWYPNLIVKVDEGLVILTGNVDSPEKKQWALDIINKTEGVVAVIDKLDSYLTEGEILKPAQTEVTKIYENITRVLPYIVSAVILLSFFILISFFAKKITKTLLLRRQKSQLLISAFANIVGISFIILGFYFAFKTSGLSGLAVTLLGGTGIISIGLGFALKRTFENYTAGIMISTKELLRIGEIVNINGFEGVVQTVTTRGTTLMDYDGNNIVIPNSDVINSVIKNLTRNPKMRTDFSVGIGYDDSIDLALEVILNTIAGLSPSVLNDPEPIAAVDSLGAATVNLKVYFWFDAVQISLVKIRSLVIKNVKEALMQAQVSMPDDAREVVFASPLKIQQLSGHDIESEQTIKESKKVQISTKVNIDLDNEVKDIQKQALTTPNAEAGENIL